MMKAQPQYLIRANRNCRTHRPGTTIVFTGPRGSIPRGWSYEGKLPPDPAWNYGGTV